MNEAFGAGKFPVIVVTNKPDPALLFKALALKLAPFLHFVLVSSPTAQFLQRFNNAAVPSVHILVPQVRGVGSFVFEASKQAQRVEKKCSN